jgi:2,4-dienoyl-CoA reductase-like NADH-dependent reductase (Old Yellow Enzyme family)
MAPLTRFRAPNHLVSDLQATYYGQRASKGGLLITEATFIAEEAGGYPAAPGIYTTEQIKAWKGVTDAVHAKGGVIYMQLWAIGRANPGTDDVKDIVSASDLGYEGGGDKPRPMTVEEIKRYVGHYKSAALNAVEAGFDGVEIHS